MNKSLNDFSNMDILIKFKVEGLELCGISMQKYIVQCRNASFCRMPQDLALDFIMTIWVSCQARNLNSNDSLLVAYSS